MPKPEEGAEPEPEPALDLTVYSPQRQEEYRLRAKKLLEDEDERETFITESALIMLQMERDLALTLPTTRSAMQAAIRSRDNFVKKATELLTLTVHSREMRLKVLEAEKEAAEARINVLLAGGEAE